MILALPYITDSSWLVQFYRISLIILLLIYISWGKMLEKETNAALLGFCLTVGRLWSKLSHPLTTPAPAFRWTMCQGNASGLGPLTGQLWLTVWTWGNVHLLFHSHGNETFFFYCCWENYSHLKCPLRRLFSATGGEQNVTPQFQVLLHCSDSLGKLRFHSGLEHTGSMWCRSALLISCFRILKAPWLWKHLLTHRGRRRAGSNWTQAWIYYNSFQ